MRSDEDISDRKIEVRVGGVALGAADFVKKPIEHPYGQAWLGSAQEFSCYALPGELLAGGKVRVEVTLKAGIRVRLILIDIADVG